MRASLPDYPGFAARPGQDIVYDDLACTGSLIRGKCMLPTATAAALWCSQNLACVSVVWYANGTDGCSGEVASAKRSHPSDTNMRMAPSVVLSDTLEPLPLVSALSSASSVGSKWRCTPAEARPAQLALSCLHVSTSPRLACMPHRCPTECAGTVNLRWLGAQRHPALRHPQEVRYLLRREASVVLLPANELAAAVDEVTADPRNSTAWLGCVVALGALLSGDVAEVLDGVESAEACCRACRAVGLQQCNVFNYCSGPAGCR